MDPIHPIVPQSPTPAPVAPSTRTERVNRDGGRSDAEPERRRRRPARTGAPQSESRGLRSGEDEGSEDPHPHVDITV
jgi:hypothetical protein